MSHLVFLLKLLLVIFGVADINYCEFFKAKVIYIEVVQGAIFMEQKMIKLYFSFTTEYEIWADFGWASNTEKNGPILSKF